MKLKQVRLDDKYDLAQARVFVTGYQALVRLCLMQKERDRRAGLNTAGYVTGYRGSPLGTYELALSKARKHSTSITSSSCPAQRDDERRVVRPAR